MTNNYRKSINQQKQQNQEMLDLEKMFGKIKDEEIATAKSQLHKQQTTRNTIHKQQETQQSQQSYQQQIANAQSQLQNQSQQLQAMQAYSPQRVNINPEPILSPLRQQLSQAQNQTQSLREQLEQTKQLRKQQKDISKQIEKERQEQQTISNQIENQSAVEDITEAIGNIASSAVSAMGKVASSGVDAIGKTASTLFVQSLKAIRKAAKSATSSQQPSTVTSADIFPPQPSQPSRLRSSQLSVVQEDYPQTSTSALSPFGKVPPDEYDIPLLSRQSFVDTVPPPVQTQERQAQNLVPPARAQRGLRTSRIFDLDDFDTGNETDTGYTTASELPVSRLSSRRSGYHTDTGYATASETLPRQAQNLVPPAVAQPPQHKTSYYSYEPIKSTVQEPLPQIEELPLMTLEQLEDVKERLSKSNRSITAMINAKERKRNKTPEDYRLLREYQGYKNELNAYIPSIPSFRGYYGRRKQQGRGIFYFNNPSDLLKRLKLLDGSLRALQEITEFFKSIY